MSTWRVMTIEQMEKLGDEQIVQRINEALVPPDAGLASLMQPSDIVAAQFYMSELDRREKRRAEAERDRVDRNRWRVDLGLELLIVVLIGLEIVLSLRGLQQQSKDVDRQLKAFSDMQVVLSQMQDTSKATANTMIALEATTQTMADSLQKELGLFYDVSLNVVFDAGPKQLKFINTGRTNIELWGMFRPGVPPTILKEARIIPPGSGFMIEGATAYDDMVAHFPKPNEGSVPFEVYLENERHEEFVEHGWLGIHWSNDMAQITIEIVTIAPEHWTARVKKASLQGKLLKWIAQFPDLC